MSQAHHRSCRSAAEEIVERTDANSVLATMLSSGKLTEMREVPAGAVLEIAVAAAVAVAVAACVVAAAAVVVVAAACAAAVVHVGVAVAAVVAA